MHPARQPCPGLSACLVWFSGAPAPQSSQVHVAERLPGRLADALYGCRARQSSEPFIWNEALFSEVPELWADLQARGIQHGWSQSTLHEPGGIGMLSLCRSTPITEQDLQTRLQHMQWLALLAHKAFSKLIRARIASNAPSLTERELEVLRWTADGKSAQDIAEILLLSKNTVDFHIRNSINKLDVPNKTAAVVRAVLLGLFQ